MSFLVRRTLSKVSVRKRNTKVRIRIKCEPGVSPIKQSTAQRLWKTAICCRDKDSSCLEFWRGMAETRNYPIRGASHETGITEEVRDLIRNVKHAENIETWEKEKGAPEPIRFEYLRPNPDDMDNDQELPMVYYPHRGEDLSAWHSLEPSPVLLVERVKTLRNEPWWHKETCERFGLGQGTYQGKRVAVPNMSHFTQKLYTIKHLIKITPVAFPNGLPPENEFDPEAAMMTLDGKFLYHPKLKERSKKIEAGEQNSERMLMKSKTFQKEAAEHFQRPWSTPLGNHNYHRNYSKDHPERTNQITDSAVKFKY